MADRYSLVIVLCEDNRHESFVRRYLKKRGIPGPRIHVIHYPEGGQCGEQFVRENFAKQVRAIRSKSQRMNVGLIAVIDADMLPCANRVRQLDKALQETKQKVRRRDEPIAVLVPKRHIETWIRCLCGHAVNESDSFRRSVGNKDIKPAVDEFLRCCPHDVPPAWPPSLKTGCTELAQFASRFT